MDELQEWFDDFWWLYPNDLCDKKKGAKPKALDSAKKIYKKGGIKELNRITANTRALVIHDKKEWTRGGKPYRWPMVSSYLNQGYYDREIESASDKPFHSVGKSCVCGDKVQLMGKCLKCHEKETRPTYKREMYERLKKMGLEKLSSESRSDYAMRCREYGRKHYPVLRGM